MHFVNHSSKLAVISQCYLWSVNVFSWVQFVTFIFLVKPVQIKAPSSVCNVEGQTYDDGDSMEVYRGDLASGECEQCTCKEGKLDCHHIFHCVLNDSSCDSYVKKPDQCCPECQRGMVAGRGGEGILIYYPWFHRNMLSLTVDQCFWCSVHVLTSVTVVATQLCSIENPWIWLVLLSFSI